MRGAALVTGAGRRIGRRLAIECAELGFDVALHYRGDPQAVEATAAAVRARGRRAAGVTGDLAQAAVAAQVIGDAASALGALTLLVNNASIFEDDRLETLEAARFDRHMAINLRAPLLMIQAFAAQIEPGRADGEAAVINLLDQRVHKLNPQFFSYTLSKAALWSATRTAAQALAPRVRVNAIAPGPTLASIHQDAQTFAREAAAAPLGHGPAVDDLAAALAYLVDARSVTGQTLTVDGGQHLAWRTSDIID